jgi:hypothetical protein
MPSSLSKLRAIGGWVAWRVLALYRGEEVLSCFLLLLVKCWPHFAASSRTLPFASGDVVSLSRSLAPSSLILQLLLYLDQTLLIMLEVELHLGLFLFGSSLCDLLSPQARAILVLRHDFQMGQVVQFGERAESSLSHVDGRQQISSPAVVD